MMSLRAFIMVFSVWQMLHLVTTPLVHRTLTHPHAQTLLPDPKLRSLLHHQSPAYILSTLHALYVFPRGIQHLFGLFRAPIKMKLARPRTYPYNTTLVNDQVAAWNLPYLEETDRVLWTNLVLAGYLCADLTHVIYQYPRLGSWDTICHHLTFLLCALIAGWYNLYPFMFGWLIMGEASTPLLNMRWFMIKLGQGHTTLFRVVEICFLLIFVVTRFFIYAAGLGYQLLIIADMPAHVPNWAVNITMGTVCAGFVLNLVWLGKMWRLAKGGGRKRREAVEEKANGASDKIE